ncbi:MAG: hypothetical protein PHI63_05300 [Patescibacteria group bacterium]|nr:hypothetical protein [Patescibacteria group bacterium]
MKHWTAGDSLFWFIFVGFATAGFVAVVSIATFALLATSSRGTPMSVAPPSVPDSKGELTTGDIAPFDDADLRLSQVTVLESENAYFDLVKLKDVMVLPQGASQTISDMIVGKTWDAELAGEIISRNSQAFEIFAQAARKPKFQDPAADDPDEITPDMVYPPITRWRDMAGLSAIRALSLAQQGNDIAAIDEALNSVRVGQKIQESQATTIEYLVAMGMKEKGLTAVQRILATSKFAGDDLLPHIQSLGSSYHNSNDLVVYYKAQYQVARQSMDDLAAEIAEGKSEALDTFFEGEVNPILTRRDYYFHPNKTKALFAEWARRGIAEVNKPCGEIYADDQRKAPLRQSEEYLAMENGIGQFAFDLGTTALTSVRYKKCEDDLLVSATQALLAVKAFKSDTGSYPAKLEALVPRYLPTAPQDPYDGKTLKYSAEKKIIYSVGDDLVDAGGSTGDTWRNVPDPTFVINF